MANKSNETKKMFKKLFNYNTSTVSNVVATYPENPSCLGSMIIVMVNNILVKR